MGSTFTSLHYHFVFSTKHRDPWIKEEFVALSERHEIEYEERYLWD